MVQGGKFPTIMPTPHMCAGSSPVAPFMMQIPANAPGDATDVSSS